MPDRLSKERSRLPRPPSAFCGLINVEFDPRSSLKPCWETCLAQHTIKSQSTLRAPVPAWQSERPARRLAGRSFARSPTRRSVTLNVRRLFAHIAPRAIDARTNCISSFGTSRRRSQNVSCVGYFFMIVTGSPILPNTSRNSSDQLCPRENREKSERAIWSLFTNLLASMSLTHSLNRTHTHTHTHTQTPRDEKRTKEISASDKLPMMMLRSSIWNADRKIHSRQL